MLVIRYLYSDTRLLLASSQRVMILIGRSQILILHERCYVHVCPCNIEITETYQETQVKTEFSWIDLLGCPQRSRVGWCRGVGGSWESEDKSVRFHSLARLKPVPRYLCNTGFPKPLHKFALTRYQNLKIAASSLATARIVSLFSTFVSMVRSTPRCGLSERIFRQHLQQHAPISIFPNNMYPTNMLFCSHNVGTYETEKCLFGTRKWKAKLSKTCDLQIGVSRKYEKRLVACAIWWLLGYRTSKLPFVCIPERESCQYERRKSEM